MKTYEKIYIGKGRKVENMDIVSISIQVDKLDELKNQAYKNLLFFEVAKMKETDQYGNTHTCYYSKRIDEITQDEISFETPAKTAAAKK
ncbi:MAG: hypothetical protein ACOYOV_13285 [Bacteroidales bacterium]